MEAHFAEQALFNLNLIRFRYRLIETIVYQKCMLAFLTSFRIWINSQTVFFIFIKMSKKMFFRMSSFWIIQRFFWNFIELLRI